MTLQSKDWSSRANTEEADPGARDKSKAIKERNCNRKLGRRIMVVNEEQIAGQCGRW